MVAASTLTIAGALLGCVGWARSRARLGQRRGGPVLSIAGAAALTLGTALHARDAGYGVALASVAVVAMAAACVFAFAAPFVIGRLGTDGGEERFARVRRAVSAERTGS